MQVLKEIYRLDKKFTQVGSDLKGSNHAVVKSRSGGPNQDIG